MIFVIGLLGGFLCAATWLALAALFGIHYPTQEQFLGMTALGIIVIPATAGVITVIDNRFYARAARR